MHPIWQWDGAALVGWIATEPTSLKRAHRAAHRTCRLATGPRINETCRAECRADWVFDDEGRAAVWNMFKKPPGPRRLRLNDDSATGGRPDIGRLRRAAAHTVAGSG
jgi:hypothetical protein